MTDMDKRNLIDEENEDVELTEDELLDMTEEDIIDKLLMVEEAPEKTYALERLGIPVTLKGLKEKEIQRLRKECTRTWTKRGQRHQELDAEEFNAALIEKATVSPNWGDRKLLSKFNLSSGREFIKRKLLAGEILALGDKVMELSGFDDELEEIEDIKN